MKSTGEVMGKEKRWKRHCIKAVASGMNIQTFGTVLLTVADKDKEEALQIGKRFVDIGYQLMATPGTAKALKEAGIPVKVVEKIGSTDKDLLDVISNGEAQIVINTLTKGKQPERDGFKIRRETVENGIPCLTSLDTARALLAVLESLTFSTEAMEKREKDQEAILL